jgi:hypothetical protein
MPPSTPTPSLTDSLITLKTQLERSLTEATTNTSHLREQLSHVNALLLNLLLPTTVPQSAQVKAEAPAAKATALAPAAEAPKPKVTPRKPKAEPQQASGERTPREMLPAYRGLKRLEAISQILAASAGEEVSIDTVIHSLFGDLSAAEHKRGMATIRI